MILASLPDSHVLWSRETGAVTLGEIRASAPEAACDEREATRKMWYYLATHPDEKPWLSGRIPADSAGSIA